MGSSILRHYSIIDGWAVVGGASHVFSAGEASFLRGIFVAKGLRSFSVLTALEMSGECVRFFSVVRRMKIGKAFVLA